MKFFVFDTETTALIYNSVRPLAKQPHIVEFYGAMVDDAGERFDELEFLCKPPIALPEETTRITGLTEADLKDAKPFSAYADEVIRFIEMSDGVVAHNLGYDWAMVENELKRIDRTVKWPIRRICTVENTEHLIGRRLKLTDLHAHLFGEGFPEAHRARNDAEATVRCFLELRQRGVL